MAIPATQDRGNLSSSRYAKTRKRLISSGFSEAPSRSPGLLPLRRRLSGWRRQSLHPPYHGSKQAPCQMQVSSGRPSSVALSATRELAGNCAVGSERHDLSDRALRPDIGSLRCRSGHLYGLGVLAKVGVLILPASDAGRRIGPAARAKFQDGRTPDQNLLSLLLSRLLACEPGT